MIAFCYHSCMAQALIRNLDDDLLTAYREAAEANGRSLEAELREALRIARPPSPREVEEAMAKFAAFRALTADVERPSTAEMLRDVRDGND